MKLVLLPKRKNLLKNPKRYIILRRSSRLKQLPDWYVVMNRGVVDEKFKEPLTFEDCEGISFIIVGGGETDKYS